MRHAEQPIDKAGVRVERMDRSTAVGSLADAGQRREIGVAQDHRGSGHAEPMLQLVERAADVDVGDRCIDEEWATGLLDQKRVPGRRREPDARGDLLDRSLLGTRDRARATRYAARVSSVIVNVSGATALTSSAVTRNE
jgi:hypothetical protein